MYKSGDIIVYTTYGLCRVEDITERVFNNELKQYYILKPLNDPKASLQIQTDNPMTVAKIRDVLTSAEAMELIHQIPYIEPYWIENENERKRQFSDILRTGTRPQIIGIIRSVYEHSKGLKDKGRKLHACDEQACKDAEKIIYEELSYVLEIERSKILDFIISEVGEIR